MPIQRRLATPLAAGFSVLLLLGGVTLAQQAHPTEPHHPPKEGKFVRGHWTPYDPPDPAAFPEDSQLHTIVVGDTLWDLSARFLGDPWLWPQIWDQNRYILDSHWIYPGDPLLIPAPPTVLGTGEGDETGVEVVETVPEQPEAPPQQPVAVNPLLQPGQPVIPQPGEGAPTLVGPELRPVADETDLYCSSYVVPSPETPDLSIAEREDHNKELLADFDIVYIAQGLDDGVAPGQEYSVLRARGQQVNHPATRELLGEVVTQMGRIRVIAAQAHTSTAMIVDSCFPIMVGDWLVPFVERPVPLVTSSTLDRHEVVLPEAPDGFIVYGQGDGAEFGTGDIVEIDLAAAPDLKPGDSLVVYRDYRRSGNFYSTRTIADAVPPEELQETGEFPVVLGQMVIVGVRDHLATGKIIRAYREMNVGDKLARL
ncbi:MAG: LysM peptidoglycan-binding domain-containing protein [Acidobacteriota bacterium]|jgi:hypothetical protein